jgi:zinc/manganese transport system substrate-binding protein
MDRPGTLRLGLLLGCLAATPVSAALRVVATTPEYGSLAAAIGGDAVKVTALAKPTEDPHFVDAKPSHIVTLNRADVLIEGGADLEIGWLPPLIQGARNKKIQIGAPGRIRASEGIQLLDVPAVLDRSQGDVHAVGNPHFMMDPEDARIAARHITEVLCQLDSSSCETFRANLAAFEKRLDAKIVEWQAELGPFKGRPVVTYHTTWRYFAQRFDIVADTFLEPKPGIPPSPPHLAAVIDKMQSDDIRVILVEPFQSRKTAEAVADRTGAIVVDVCQFPGGLPGTDDDYIAMMDANVKAIAAAFRQAG